MLLDPEFLEILACPLCKGRLASAGEEALRCAACRCAFPVREGIPVLLVDEAVREPSEGAKVPVPRSEPTVA